MTSANMLASAAVSEHSPSNISPQVREVVERHRQALFGLAESLLATGYAEEEVAQILDRASQSFFLILESKLEGLLS